MVSQGDAGLWARRAQPRSIEKVGDQNDVASHTDRHPGPVYPTNRRIFRLALQTFGSNANVRRWLLFSPGSWAIDYQIPAVLLKTPQGLKMLEDFLMRLEYGV